MNDTLFALITYTAWILVLLVILASYRSYLTLNGSKAANSFKPEGSDVSEFSGRLCRAHANCYEFFPVAGGLLLAALATNNLAITEPLALYLIGARVLQSMVHIISTSIFAVYCRFALFLAQVAISIIWILQFLTLSTS